MYGVFTYFRHTEGRREHLFLQKVVDGWRPQFLFSSNPESLWKWEEMIIICSLCHIQHSKFQLVRLYPPEATAQQLSLIHQVEDRRPPFSFSSRSIRSFWEGSHAFSLSFSTLSTHTNTHTQTCEFLFSLCSCFCCWTGLRLTRSVLRPICMTNTMRCEAAFTLLQETEHIYY